MHSLDPAQEELELEAQVDQAEEPTPSPSLSKASPDASHHNYWFLFWIATSMLISIVY
jgi:hypothetical protein